ncbi:MAG TPA: cell division protein ZipA C-terminal FtsZ-binding domain-containing protein [Burkholderiales bacterium]|nr:cell division protein ZipA C-terminal FtsZ-binding domain-containing protein [Burkholderiales bacterium]
MTEFQLGLLLIGALAIIGVIVFNRVQERIATKRAERAFGSQHADVLLGESSQRREPTLEPAIRKMEREPGGATVALPDEALDYVIALSFPRPLSATAFLEYWGPLEHRFAKRVLAAGREDGSSWKRIAHGDPTVYSAFQAALQLVSRAGVVNEGELIEFRSEVENLAASLGASVTAPEMKQAMDRARELDQFCADADIQIVLNLVATAGSAFPAAKLESAIAAAGFGREPDGQYALRDADGRALYAVFAVQGESEGEIAKLGFSLDVPRVPEVRKTYESMVRFARQLAAGLGGALIDDNGRALDEQSLTAIGAELDAVRRALESRGLPPGEPLALRLFS